MVLLYGILKRAKRRKWIASNPAEDVERVSVKRSGDFNVLSPVEVEAVARVAASEQDAAIFTVAAFFPDEVGGTMADYKIAHAFMRALEGAGLKRVRFHDLRHSFCSMAVGVFKLSDVQAYAGHAQIQTTMLYVHHVPQHHAADALSRYIEKASDVQPFVQPHAHVEARGA